MGFLSFSGRGREVPWKIYKKCIKLGKIIAQSLY